MVVPFAVTDSIWPTLMAASLSLRETFDQCRVVPASGRYLQNPGVYGAERLAVLSVDFTRLHPQPDRFRRRGMNQRGIHSQGTVGGEDRVFIIRESPPTPPLPGIGPRHSGGPNGPTAKGL